MRVPTIHGAALRRAIAGCAMLGLVAIGVTATTQPAHAWWRGGIWCCSVGIMVPPVVVAPPVYYAPPPVYYAPPAYYAPGPVYAPAPRVWIRGHWAGGYWVAGHWR